ncbi:Hypothetical protein CINCED_3A012551 [Cinara cedri]|nr:Hypothetical protein CINCED_3A012551 [Cinara cedri]
MTIQERICIENLFQVGCLNILVATSTLAMKVNILAQLIIIKSTEYYTFNCYKEYNECQVLQMIGRAGRPQVDTSATAIIMTKQSTKDQYKQILTGNRFLESHLHKNLIEHLNTEIFMGTINNVTVAMDWMQSTFLYIRACKSPQNYGMIKTLNVNEVEHKLQNLCLTSIKSLACTGLINCFDGNNKIISKPEGEIMNKYSISFATMNLYMQLKGTESLRDMLRILTCSKEFEHIKFRRTDKENLNSLNKNQQSRSNIIRFPIDEGINTRETKINCLLQAILGSLKISNGLLAQDAHTIILISIRLTKALKEIAFRGTMFESARSACILAKCIITKLWEQSEYVSKLIPRVGLVLSGLLVSNGKTTLESISDTDPRELERILKRNAPFGNHILDFITQIPKYKVRVSFDKYIKLLILKISLMDYSNISKTIRSHTISILVGDSENCLLKAHQICNEDFLKQEGVIDMTVLLKNECFFHIPDYTVTVCLISDQWIGIDIEIKLNLDNSKEYIKESTNAEHKKSTEHYKKMEQISINENEKKKCTTQMNIKKYVCNVFSKDQDQDLKVINKLHMEENNKKKNHANKSRDATHNVTGKMKIGMKTKNNNNGKINYCFKSNKDNLNKYFSYNELMNDNIFCDLFLPDDNSCIISETFDLAEKCCFRENAMQTEYWTNNTQIKVVDPIQLQCSRNALPNEKLENNKFINLDKYNKIAHKKNSLCFNDLLLENKENVNPNKLERLKKRSLRILSSKLFGKPSTQTIHKSEVKSNHSINDSKMSNHNVSSKSVLPKEKLSVNAVIDGKSSKTATQFEASRDFLVTKFESSTLNIIAPTSGSTSNLTSGHLTRQIEANLKVTSDFYASHKQFSEFANDSGSSSCGENVLKFVCDYSYEQTKPDAVGPFTEASGLIAYHHCPSDKVTLDKFFRASKYLRRFKAPNTDKLDSTYDSMKSWMCGDGEKRSSNAVKRIKFMHEPLETSFEDVHKLFAHRFTNRNEYNKDDSEVSSVATITARQYLRYDLPTSTS